METVTSSDGTVIAYDKHGRGPALILIGGAFSTRQAATALAEELAPHFTTYTYDRRGRGDSGNTEPYSVIREIEDLSALIKASGGPALVYGHSSGAGLALEAAANGASISRLALYEPPYFVGEPDNRPGPELTGKIAELLAADARSAAVELFLTTAVQVPSDVVTQMKQSPAWPGLEQVAPTLLYDFAVMGDSSVPTAMAAGIPIPTLVIVGGRSAQWAADSGRALSEILPRGRFQVLEGQDHGADPKSVLATLVEFFT